MRMKLKEKGIVVITLLCTFMFISLYYRSPVVLDSEVSVDKIHEYEVFEAAPLVKKAHISDKTEDYLKVTESTIKIHVNVHDLSARDRGVEKKNDTETTETVVQISPKSSTISINVVRPRTKPTSMDSSTNDITGMHSNISNSGPTQAENEQTSNEDVEKYEAVKEMMRHAWNGYRQYAWGFNELKPKSGGPHLNSVFGGGEMGATIVDAMDTLYIMGMRDEFAEGRKWIEDSLWFQNTGLISVFETNIRYVGGLLSLFSLTGDTLFRDRAQLIADKLMPAFKTPHGIPYSLIDVKTGRKQNYYWAHDGSAILSEFGTLHMEFAYLSDVTGNSSYVDAVKKIRNVIKTTSRAKSKNPLLFPNYFDLQSGRWKSEESSFGALGDSFYEYLLKEWIRTNYQDVEAKKMLDDAMVGVEKYMLQESKKSGLIYVADIKYGRAEGKMQHLTCFAGGFFALLAQTSQNLSNVNKSTNTSETKETRFQKLMTDASQITSTCHESYVRSATRIGPDTFRFYGSVEATTSRSNERGYLLRPETVESYFYMWRFTHNVKYREWAWDFIKALNTSCRVKHGFSGLRNVYSLQSGHDDVQQSFFLAETLKYLYLTFRSDDFLSLDEWVFNTEAHPLPIRGVNSHYYPTQTLKTIE